MVDLFGGLKMLRDRGIKMKDEQEFDFIVLSREQAAEFVTDRPYLYIAVKDPGTKDIETYDTMNQIACVNLAFLDRDPSKFNAPELCCTNDDVNYLLEVLARTKKYINRIVIACENGVTIAPSIAAGLSDVIGNDNNSILDYPKYKINWYITRLILQLGNLS